MRALPSALTGLTLAAFAAGAPSRPAAAEGLQATTLNGAAPYGNPIADDRLYAHFIFNQLEGRVGDGTYLRFDGMGFVGDDYNKIWLKAEGRYNADNMHKESDGDTELLYGRSVTRYFDVQVGVRSDVDSSPNRTYAAFGFQGLAIGFWNIAVTGYASEGGHLALRTQASYDLYLTQRLVLQPQFETNSYSRSEASRGTGSGFSDIDAGLRLRYDITRKFSPYIGIAYQRYFMGTEGLRRQQGLRSGDVRFLGGVRVWF